MNTKSSLSIKKYNIPKWMCIGVPKAGTTSLYSCLKDHPEIWIPQRKETQFFCSPNYEKGMEWYMEKYYKGADPGMAVGELTPKYLIHKDVPERIKENLKEDLKFLVILRHPIDRAWSHYCHAYKRFRDFSFRPTEDLSFEEAIEAEPERLAMPGEYGWTHGTWLAYFYTGLYATHLKNWFSVFDREQFLIMTMEDLVDSTKETVDKIVDHLGIARFDGFPEFVKSNSYSKSEMKEETRSELIERYRPHNKELEELLGRSFESWNK